MRAFTVVATAGIAASLVFGQRTPAQQPSQLFTITINLLNEEIKARTEVMIKVRLTNVSSHDIPGGSGYHAQGLEMSYANNPGTVAEQQIGAPGLETQQFVSNVTSALNTANTNINSGTNSPEPPGPDYNASNVLQGYTNFAPYVTCQ
jgi:hypothetical protein